MLTRTVLLAGLALLLPGASLAQRLPAGVAPEHYELSFAPDLQAETFEGRARIRTRVSEPARTITLHAAELTIHSAEVEAGGRTLTADVQVDAPADLITLRLPSAVDGTVVLDFRYAGTLNNRLRGFYISRTQRRKYAATQFQVADARRAFPCFDEPAFKATFDISLTIDEGDVAISNGAVLADSPGPAPGTHTVRFVTTPKMSTYLVAMAVGDFKCLDATAGDTPVRVCATPEKVALGAFGLDAARHVLPWFNRYYGIPYPFGKLDIVALPDFAAGAMENTAAIFYRESYLLADEQKTPESSLKFIAFVMAHEIAHQWFGDLVTLRWWDDIWLNEGFSNWAGMKAVDGWRGWSFTKDRTLEAITAMTADSMASTRQIRTPVETPRAIEEAFDALTYDKAASVLRMIERYVGEDAFQAGVSTYLRRFSYSNASAEDFWDTLADASGKPVDRLMRSFIERPGVPQVEVTYRCEEGGTRVDLAQQRFLLTKPARTPETAPWTVPVCFERPGQDAEACVLVTESRASVTLPGCSPWLHANDEGLGYYRVAYDPAAVSALARAALPDLSEPEQLVLEADAWAMVRSGDLPITSYLELVEAFARTSSAAATLHAAAPHLDFISDVLVTDSEREAWQQWIRARLGPLGARLGWDPAPGESVQTQELRAAVLELLGRAGEDRGVLQKAREIVLADLEGTRSPDPSIAAAAYRLAAFAGDEALYDKIRQAIAASSNPVDYYRRQDALTRFTDPALVDRTLDYALSEAVRSQDAPSVLRKLLANPAAERRVWEAIKRRWPEVVRKADIARGPLQIVRALQLCEPGDAEDVRQFFDTHPAAGAAAAVRRTVERIETCVATREAQRPRLQGALARR